MNHKKINKPILVYDITALPHKVDCGLTAQKAYKFSSINQAEKELKIHHSFIKKHLENGSVYIGRNGRKLQATLWTYLLKILLPNLLLFKRPLTIIIL